MNLSFAALMLFVLALPGWCFREAYRRGWRWRHSPLPVARRPLAEELLLGLAFAGVLHVIWCVGACLLSGWFQWKVAPYPRAVFVLLLGEPKSEIPRVISAVTGHWGCVLAYLVSLYLFASLVGWGMHKLAFKWTVLQKLPLMKLNDDWIQILHKDKEMNTRTILTATVESAGLSYLYRGELVHVLYGADGEPHRFMLKNADRRCLRAGSNPGVSGDPDVAKVFSSIDPGDLFVLRHADCKTLNMIYLEEPQDAPLPGYIERILTRLPLSGKRSEPDEGAG